MRAALLPGLALLSLAALAGLYLFLSPSARETGHVELASGPDASGSGVLTPQAQDAGDGAARAIGVGTRQAAEAPGPTARTSEQLLSGTHAAAQTLRGSLRTLGGPALAGARVELLDRTGKPVAQATSSDEGSFTLYLPRPVQAGRLEVQAPGHVPFSVTGLRVQEGAQKSLGPLHLDSAAPFEGRVVDRRGQPLRDVRAILHINARGSRLELAAITGPNGVFRFAAAPSSGRHVLELIPPGGSSQRFPVTLPGARTPEFRL